MSWGKFSSRRACFLIPDTGGTINVSYLKFLYKASESLPRKILQSRSMVLVQVTIFFIIIYMLESLTIIVQSSFTVTVLVREWMHFKRLSPVEMILTSIGICHFCLQFVSMIHNFSSYFGSDIMFGNIGTIWEFINILTFWLTGLLALIYCVKVSSFTHPIFLWLRWRISRLVPWFILGTLMISCVMIIPSAVRSHIRMQLTDMKHLPRNSTFAERLKMLRRQFSKPFMMIGLSIPFLLFLASTILLMALLIQHWKQMQSHNTSHCNSTMKVQSTALRSLATFFIFFTSYFLAVLITYVGIIFDNRSSYWAWEAVFYAILCIHSTSLMLSSPTLKKVLKIK